MPGTSVKFASSKTAAFLEMTGDKKLAKKLAALGEKMERRGATSAVGKGLTAIARKAKSLAPTKAQRRAVGTSNKRNRRRGGVHESKLGVNVGKKRSSSSFKPHAVPLTTGTKERRRKRVGGLFKGSKNTGTGRVTGSNFIDRAMKEGKTEAVAKMVQSVRDFLAKQGAKPA